MMVHQEQIEDFLRDLSTKLPAGTLRSRRVLQEAESHLNECIASLRSAGMPADEATQEAIRRFGTAKDFVGAFATESPLEPENEKMIRIGLSLLAGLTAVYALLHIGFSIVNVAEDSWSWAQLKLMLGTLILAQGVITLSLLWTKAIDAPGRRLVLFMGSLCLIALGSANAVWTVHLGMTTNDWEYYGLVGGGLLMVQGALTAWVSRPNVHNIQTHSAV